MLIGLFTILVTNVAAQSCPANLNPKAQIVLVTARMVPLDVLGVSAVDTNLTFFREVLGYDDDEIQQETENALQFFNERFGLDFSLSPPNELGLRFFKMPFFNQLGDLVMYLQPSIAGFSLETSGRDALMQFVVDILSTLLESSC